MFRDKMKVITTVVLALSFLMGELALSVPGVAFAANQAATPVTSVPTATARWARCNVDGDFDADDYCWVAGARYFQGNGFYFFGNGRYILRNRYLLPNGLVVRNGYILRNGQIIGYINYLGNPIYYYGP
jgi:hypothetical protein